ncbi:hypothetical protein MKQ68_18205 [Chitinophaga horti]|uniref:Uncharacterized protein n=1 Tax=Chitinophaga horti TaxID=2920382 RepID=A0ABY6IXA6_9BACT|nr:hypothetical protein [Chitinophaga horti]UYQ92022.1 hypothetical protein MKQ68_18205 [Chitinophaga horti]
MKGRNLLFYSIAAILVLVFGINSYRENRRAARFYRENERLLRENRDLRASVEMTSGTARQIAARKDMVQHQADQFVDQRTYYRHNWKQFVSVSTGDYRTGLIGGIKDLDIIVQNQTEYPIDNVVVTVQYIRNKGKVFKTEEYTVRSINAKGKGIVKASNSRKGMKVEVSLKSVTSQAMNLCWSKDKKVAADDPDPYLCTNLQ